MDMYLLFCEYSCIIYLQSQVSSCFWHFFNIINNCNHVNYCVAPIKRYGSEQAINPPFRKVVTINFSVALIKKCKADLLLNTTFVISHSKIFEEFVISMGNEYINSYQGTIFRYKIKNEYLILGNSTIFFWRYICCILLEF